MSVDGARDTQVVGLWLMGLSLLAGLYPAALALRLWLTEKRATKRRIYE